MDPGAAEGESQNAWEMLRRSLRKRTMTGYDLEDMSQGIESMISQYFASLGRKSRGTAKAHERAKKAAAARWGKKKTV